MSVIPLPERKREEVVGRMGGVIGVVNVARVTGGFARILWRRTLASETERCHGLAHKLSAESRARKQAAGKKFHIAHQHVDGIVVGGLTSEASCLG